MNVPHDLLEGLATPCLLVDLPAAERNIQRAASMCEGKKVRLRPHFKAHKNTKLLHRQVDAGHCCGVTCQTADEALVLASAGFADILLANEVAGTSSLATLARAAALSSVATLVDDLAHVRLLTQTAQSYGVSLGVLVELDVGMGRCGLPVDSPRLLPIVQEISRSPGLAFRGLQAYEGHIMFREDRELRRTLLWQVYRQVEHERDRLARAGFECHVVSGGGTGTLELAAETDQVTEIQAGSYVLMDARYASLGLPFEPALYMATRVVSRREPSTGVLDAGLKALSTEYGLPQAVDQRIRVIGLADEHARIAAQTAEYPGIGDVVLLIPGHVDPTVNLHDALFVWSGEDGLERWPTDGRRTTVSA